MLLLVSVAAAAVLAAVARVLSLGTDVVLFVGGPILTILLVWIGVPLVVAPDEVRPSPDCQRARANTLERMDSEPGHGYDYPVPG